MDPSSEPIPAFDALWFRWGNKPWPWSLAVRRGRIERTMRSVAVVMVDEDAEYPLQLAAVEDQEPIEAFGPDGANEAFGDRVRFFVLAPEYGHTPR